MEVKSKNILNSLIPELGSGVIGREVGTSAQGLWREFFNALFNNKDYYKLYEYLLEVNATEGFWSDGEDRIIPIFKNTDIPPQYRGGSLYNLLTSCADGGQMLSSNKDELFSVSVPNYAVNIYNPDPTSSKIVCIQSFEDITYLPYVGWEETMPAVRKPYLSYVGSMNLWDEQYTTGVINTTTGAVEACANSIIPANYISCIPNQAYYFLVPEDTQPYSRYVVFYDENKAFVSATAITARGSRFDAPATAKYMKFTWTSATPYGYSEYQSGIIINYNESEFNGTYEAYRAKISKTVKSVSKGMICIPCNSVGEANALVISIRNAFDTALSLNLWLPASMRSSYIYVPNNANAITIGNQTVPFDAEVPVLITRPNTVTYYSVTLTQKGDWVVTGFPGGGTSTQVKSDSSITFRLNPSTIKVSYYIWMSEENCSVTATVGGTTKSLPGPFEVGTEVVLTATPKEGYVWSQWVYTNSNMKESSANVKTVKITTGDIYLKAVCVAATQTSLITVYTPDLGYFYLDSTENIGTSWSVDVGTTHTLVAVPQEQYTFGGWTEGVPSGQSASSTSLTLTPSTSTYTCRCRFNAPTPVETIVIHPQVASADQAHVTLYITKDGKETQLTYPILDTTYTKGAAGSIRAVTTSGYKFVSWGDGTTTANPYSFTASDESALVINSGNITIGPASSTYTVTFNNIPSGVTIKDVLNNVTFASGIAQTYLALTKISIAVTLSSTKTWYGWQTHTSQSQNFIIEQISENYSDTPLVNDVKYTIKAYTANEGITFSFDGTTFGGNTATMSAGTNFYLYMKSSDGTFSSDAKLYDNNGTTYTLEDVSSSIKRAFLTVSGDMTYTFENNDEPVAADWLTDIKLLVDDSSLASSYEDDVYTIDVPEHNGQVPFYLELVDGVTLSDVVCTCIEQIPDAASGADAATINTSCTLPGIWIAENTGWLDCHLVGPQATFMLSCPTASSKTYTLYFNLATEVNAYGTGSTVNDEYEVYKSSHPEAVDSSFCGITKGLKKWCWDYGTFMRVYDVDSASHSHDFNLWFMDGASDIAWDTVGGGYQWTIIDTVVDDEPPYTLTQRYQKPEDSEPQDSDTFSGSTFEVVGIHGEAVAWVHINGVYASLENILIDVDIDANGTGSERGAFLVMYDVDGDAYAYYLICQDK